MEQKELFICYAVFSGLSCIGSLFIIIVFCIYSELQLFAFRLVRDLAILGLLHSIAWCLPSEYLIPCQIQAISLTMLCPALVLWTSVIAISLHMKVIKFKELNEPQFLRRARMSIFLYSLLNLLLPYAMNKFSKNPYGEIGGWCWIDTESILGEICRVFNLYVPLLFALIYNSGVNICLMRTINKEFSYLELDNNRRIKLIFRLWLYPFILVICYIPVASLRIYHSIEDNYPIVWLFIAGTCASINGLLNAIVYGANKTVRKCIARSFKKRTRNEKYMSICSPDIQLLQQRNNITD